MRKITLSITCILCMAVLLLSTSFSVLADTHTPGTYQITADSLNVRSGPDKTTTLLGTVHKGDIFEVTEVQNIKWGKTTYKGNTAFISLDYSKLISAAPGSSTGSTDTGTGSGTSGTSIGTGSTNTGSTNTGSTGTSNSGTSNSTTGTTYRIVCSTSLNVRSGPGTSYSKLGSLKNGATITVTGITNNWGKFNYNGKTGYVCMTYCTKVADQSQPSAPKEETGSTNTGSTGTSNSGTSNSTTGTRYQVVCNTTLNVRSGAGTSYSKLGSLGNGTIITITGITNNWGKFDYNGKTGYVCMDYCKKVEEPSQPVTMAPPAPENNGTASDEGTAPAPEVSAPAPEVSAPAPENNDTTAPGMVGTPAPEVSAPAPTDTPVQENTGKQYKVSVSTTLNVRSGPGSSYSKIGSLSNGTLVTVYTVTNGWGQIDYSGKTGYVSMDYCKLYDNGTATPQEPSYTAPTTTYTMVAHGGSRTGGASMNSKAAFEAAGTDGFWGIEGDCRPYNGGFAMAHDTASSSSPSFATYLDVCKKYGCTAIIDLKDMNQSPDKLRQVVDIVRSKGMIKNAVFQTGSSSALNVIRTYAPDARLWVLVMYESNMSISITAANNVKAECIDMSTDIANMQSWIAKCHANGLKVCGNVYLSKSTMTTHKSYGMDYFMCNKPL